MDDISVLEAIISCPVCMEVYKDPRVLPCQHVFCEHCLNTYILSLRKETSQVKNERRFTCPTCREKISLPMESPTKKLPKAFYINGVIEYYNKTKGSIPQPSAPPEEQDSPKVKNRKVSHQLTQEQYTNLSEYLNKNPKDCYEKAREFIDSQDQSRFGSSVKELKRNSQSPQNFENSDFDRVCQIENLKSHLQKNKVYSSLNDNQGLCQLMSNSNKLVDMHIINVGGSDVSRVIVTSNETSNQIWFHCKKINLTSDSLNKKVNLDNKVSLSNENTISKDVYLELEGYKIHRIFYLRYYGKRLYVTCSCSQNGKERFGLVVSFEVQEANLVKETPEKILINPVISNHVKLDKNAKNANILAGLDIDRKEGELYFVSPANGSIHRVDLLTLKPKDNEWIIRGFLLEYVAYNPVDKEIWASCPDQDRVIIMDRNSGKYQESETKSTLGIDLSQIICTTDNRIIGLDKITGQIHWLKTKDNYLFSQDIEQSSFTSKTSGNKITSIQPMEDIDYATAEKDRSRHPLIGGVVCTSANYSYLLYPKTYLTRPGTMLVMQNFIKFIKGS